MEMREILELKKKYSALPDEEIIDMLREGKGGYVEGAYELLLSEAKERGIGDRLEDNKETQEVQENPALNSPQAEPETFVQLMIINNETDFGFLKSVLGEAGIVYYSQDLSLRGANLPVSLMVVESQVKKTIDLLKDFKPNGSIALW